MLTSAIRQDKSAIGDRVRKFGLAVAASPPLLSRSNQLMFLCGANQSAGVPSARREAIKRFVENLSPDNRVIYAEGVFSELTKFGHARNVLDLEHEISDIADKILIVLESPSAFCELGAFAHQRFRKKLVIVNNSAFKGQSSFINTGPLAAAEEVKAPILWYPMAPDGIVTVDGVGATFNELKTAIETRSSSRGVRLTGDVSTLEATKSSLYFVHDLVLFTGPISNKELVEFMVVAFGKKSYDILTRLLGVLRSADLVRSFNVGGTWVYESTIGRPFLQFDFKVSALMAAFRAFHVRCQPSRFRR